MTKQDQAPADTGAAPLDLEAAIGELALWQHKTVDGEYGCPGLTCPGVQRLIEFARKAITLGQQETCQGSPIKKRCRDFCPPTWTGHWREWHRGHNCHLDDGQPPPFEPENFSGDENRS